MNIIIFNTENNNHGLSFKDDHSLHFVYIYKDLIIGRVAAENDHVESKKYPYYHSYYSQRYFSNISNHNGLNGIPVNKPFILKELYLFECLFLI